MKSRFIKLNHGLVNKETIVGVSDVFWSEVEVKPRKSKNKKNTLGPTKNKTKRGWGFSVFTLNHKITVFPTLSTTNYSSNTRELTLQRHKEFINKLGYEEQIQD
jgi:hypothetical protein